MTQSIFAYIVGGVLLLTALLFLARPLKKLLKLALRCAIGCAGLIAFNFVGGLAGLYVGVNAITALVLGLLGLPGFVLLFLLQLIFQ